MDSERNQIPKIGRTESRVDIQVKWADLRGSLAEERTFNAWLRSGLAIMAFSLAISRFTAVDSSWLPDLYPSASSLLAPC